MHGEGLQGCCYRWLLLVRSCHWPHDRTLLGENGTIIGWIRHEDGSEQKVFGENTKHLGETPRNHCLGRRKSKFVKYIGCDCMNFVR